MFWTDYDAWCFTVWTILNCSGTDCSLLFQYSINRNNVPFVAQISEYILTMFCSCRWWQLLQMPWKINYVRERSDSLKVILFTCLWFRVVPLPVTYISSAAEFDGCSHIVDHRICESTSVSYLCLTLHSENAMNCYRLFDILLQLNTSYICVTVRSQGILLCNHDHGKLSLQWSYWQPCQLMTLCCCY